jgi:Glycosyl transferase family 90
LHSLVTAAKQTQAKSLQYNPPSNSFSPRPSDVVDDIPAHYGTRALEINRQFVWLEVIASCPLNSPVRKINNGTDLIESYAQDPLGFIYNTTAFSDVCNQPSLPYHHGFFDRPNKLQYYPTLLPIISASKVSSFNDLIIPSPWYYNERTSLDDSKDMSWELKRDQLHWRGGTSTGFSANGGWRRHHRQRFVKALDKIQNPVNVLKFLDNAWVQDVMEPDIAQRLFDVKFGGVSDRSSEEDIAAQQDEFEFAVWEDQQDVWKWKFLLDMDGHGLSGRFYALMKSKSLVFKCTMFREWHDEWLRPWVHYIPLGLNGTDWFEAIRFFALEESGRAEAERIATESHRWSRSVLRREDMEAWMFRFLIESGFLPFVLTIRYARVIDDQRESIGFWL